MCDQELIFLSSMILYQRASWLPLSLSSPDAVHSVHSVLRSFKAIKPHCPGAESGIFLHPFPGRTQPPPPPVELEDDVEWEVEEILDSRIQRGKIQYLVHWLGYGPHERTWEPPDHLSNATEAVAEFHQRYPNRPAPKDIPPDTPARHRR